MIFKANGNGAVTLDRPMVVHATISRAELMKRAQAALLTLEHFMEGLKMEERPEEVKPLPRKPAAIMETRKNYTSTDPGQRKVEGVTCPECGDEMRQRTSVYGDFLGCINYPTCQGKRSLDGRVPVPKRRTP